MGLGRNLRSGSELPNQHRNPSDPEKRPRSPRLARAVWRGTRPRNAANSRPDLKVLASPIVATSAVAVSLVWEHHSGTPPSVPLGATAQAAPQCRLVPQVGGVHTISVASASSINSTADAQPASDVSQRGETSSDRFGELASLRRFAPLAAAL